MITFKTILAHVILYFIFYYILTTAFWVKSFWALFFLVVVHLGTDYLHSLREEEKHKKR